jgi:hypothetical protein
MALKRIETKKNKMDKEAKEKGMLLKTVVHEEENNFMGLIKQLQERIEKLENEVEELKSGK